LGSVADFVRLHPIIGLDTPIFIYHFEGNARYIPATRVVFESLASALFLGVTSVITLVEINVVPISSGRPDLEEQYFTALQRFPNLSLADIGASIARKAAELRARYRLLTPDALQFAACLEHGATGFITNDRTLQRMAELDVLVLEDTDDLRGQAHHAR